MAVRARPGAKKTAITGIYGEGQTAQLKVAVSAPPIEGRANFALVAFLSELFVIPRIKIEIVAGELSRSKAFLLQGVTREKAESILSGWMR
ncbi:MAG: DUF167 domain-containing protein [Terracidiphilus sp.]